jgi:hypothetical protein
MPLSQQEKTMLKRKSENTAPEVLTEEQLELVSGGGYVGPAAKIEGTKPVTLGDVARFVFTGSV